MSKSSIILILLMCLLQAGISAAQESQRFTLYYSSDVRGETEPCG